MNRSWALRKLEVGYDTMRVRKEAYMKSPSIDVFNANRLPPAGEMIAPPCAMRLRRERRRKHICAVCCRGTYLFIFF